MEKTTISVPKRILQEMIAAGNKFRAAEDELEDFLLTADPNFIKRMRQVRKEHQEGTLKDWVNLKTKYGV